MNIINDDVKNAIEKEVMDNVFNSIDNQRGGGTGGSNYIKIMGIFKCLEILGYGKWYTESTPGKELGLEQDIQNFNWWDGDIEKRASEIYWKNGGKKP